MFRKNFDFVYDSHLLHCIIGADRAGVFASVKRVLKPGGYFLVDTMCFSKLTLKVEYFDLDTKYTIIPDGTATRYIGEDDDLVDELKTAGFTILSHHLEIYPVNGHNL